MSLLLRATLLLAAPAIAVGALGVYERAPVVASTAVAQRQLVDQPSHWVPFSAELRRIHEDDGSVFVGRQYRDSNGSTRNETGRSFDNINSIAIKNVPEATFYHWTPQQGWTSQPMTLPPGGWMPVPRIMNETLREVSDTVEAFRLLRFESAGRVFYQAPQLNMFTLVTLVKCKFDATAACGTWYSNIRIAEPPVSYFSLADGVEVVALTTPGGIVAREGPALQ
jgi:hypothetical protein